MHGPSMLVHRTGEREGQGVRGREASRCQDRGHRGATWLWPLRGSAVSCFGLRVSPGLATKPTLVQAVMSGLQFLAAQSLLPGLSRAVLEAPPETGSVSWVSNPPLEFPG